MVSEVNYWFVGAYNDDNGEDRTDEFVSTGIWINMFKDRLLENVNSMNIGDRIAIKSTFTQKIDLPFDNRDQTVSVMAIKAVGTIIENLNDGHTVKVDWKVCEPTKKWYFYTNRKTIWKLNSEKLFTQDLINFAFNNESQDLDKFRNAPYWRERFGDRPSLSVDFTWTAFYSDVASAVRSYRNNRDGLLGIVKKLSDDVDAVQFPQDKFPDGSTGPWTDICPFSFFSFLNRPFKLENRIEIAKSMAKHLGINSAIPTSFAGVPLMMHNSAWFFRYADARDEHDIDKLWDLFEAAIDWADELSQGDQKLENAFDIATQIPKVKWNISFAMYWIRPWNFVPLDAKTRNYLEKFLRFPVNEKNPEKLVSGKQYLDLLRKLQTKFEDPNYPAHSFPELSHQAFELEYIDDPVDVEDSEDPSAYPTDEPLTLDIYTVQNILDDGSFIEKDILEEYLETWEGKKNLILQGPPGTGKTWLAKRLGYALIGEKSKERLIAMQFHANLSYEDFVRGFRPTKNRELELVDGPFLEMINRANTEPDKKFVFVIEEINRGNPAQVFGELLTLLENDKRNPDEALQMTYKHSNERIFIPKNLYVIGTMNLADKSLAMMDFALRRRFAFITLTPNLNDTWHKFLVENFGLSVDLAKRIQNSVSNLNDVIEVDSNLGSAYKIGHSFFVPTGRFANKESSLKWLESVIETQIKPTLDEYWFDNPKFVEKEVAELKKAIFN